MVCCRIALIVLTLLLAACAPDRPVVMVYSGNLDGELEPCGCSPEGDFGGIRRRATMLQQLRSENPNALVISAGGLLAIENERDRLKSQYILKGFKSLAYDAVGLQWRDLTFGVPFLQTDPLPWVAGNWLGEEFEKQKTVQKAQVTFSFFSWLAPEDSPFLKMAGKIERVAADTAKLASAMEQSKKQGAVTVLFTALPLERAQKLVPMQWVDILFIKANYEEYVEPKKVQETLVLQPGSRGMRLGKLLLTVRSGGKIKSWQHEVIALPNTIADYPGLQAWYDEYNEKVKAAYEERVKIRKAKEEGIRPFIGAQACAGCHAQAYTTWAATKHAQAFSVLERVNKAFDPDCIGCHTVGFNKPGGYIDTQITEDLANVQCESCHGAGRTHSESGGKLAVPNKAWAKEQICGQCHTRSHSPAFKFELYWPKIAHGAMAESNAPQGSHAPK